MQYSDEKVDVLAESSEDSADAAGPVHPLLSELWRCFRFRFRQFDRVVDAPAVQPTAQKQMSTIKKIPQTTEILHVVQRQCLPSRRSRRSLSYRSRASCDEEQVVATRSWVFPQLQCDELQMHVIQKCRETTRGAPRRPQHTERDRDIAVVIQTKSSNTVVNSTDSNLETKKVATIGNLQARLDEITTRLDGTKKDVSDSRDMMVNRDVSTSVAEAEKLIESWRRRQGILKSMDRRGARSTPRELVTSQQ